LDCRKRPSLAGDLNGSQGSICGDKYDWNKKNNVVSCWYRATKSTSRVVMGRSKIIKNTLSRIVTGQQHNRRGRLVLLTDDKYIWTNKKLVLQAIWF